MLFVRLEGFQLGGAVSPLSDRVRSGEVLLFNAPSDRTPDGNVVGLKLALDHGCLLY